MRYFLAMLLCVLPVTGQGSKTVDSRLSTATVHRDGIQSLSDLRGMPVLVDFWGKN